MITSEVFGYITVVAGELMPVVGLIVFVAILGVALRRVRR
jgi:hypothetical protein